jgi:serine/threonine protein kinase
VSQKPSPPEDRAAAPAQADLSTVLPPTFPPAGVPLPPAVQFARYRIIAELGRGGMGVVYRARDTQLDRDVALKTVRTDLPAATDRFLREARAMAAVRHDHVVEIYDYGEENGVRFVAMPLLAGETLAARLRRQAPLPPSEVIRIGREMAEGLAAVHEKGLIHRDLKPSNVWLEAPSGRVKLLDFGLARDPRTDDGMTSPGALVGTPAYMSPEQVNGLALDARTDLFSLGSVLYEAATGQPAFLAPTQTATLQAVGEKTLPPARTVNPAIPAALSGLIERLHRKRPADRPASAAEVAEALARLADGAPEPSAKPGGHGAPENRPPGAPRRRSLSVAILVTVACALLLIVGAILAYSVIGPSRDRSLSTAAIGVAPPEGIATDTGPGKHTDRAPARAAESLRVRTLEVHQFRRLPENKYAWEKRFGFLPTDDKQESFAATPEDDMKVTALLSRPAYCYLIVFRADGKDDVIYPQDQDMVPEFTDVPKYPSSRRDEAYGLTDGTGLWVVALAARDRPLPPYAVWRKLHPSAPWEKSGGQAGVILRDDGSWWEMLTSGREPTRGDRGPRKAAGVAPVVEVVDWLKAETGGVVSAVGFTVQAAKE